MMKAGNWTNFLPSMLFVLIAVSLLPACATSSLKTRGELTLDWFEGKTLQEVADGLEKRGFYVADRRAKAEGEAGEEIVVRHENYRRGFVVRTGLIIVASARDTSSPVTDVRFSFFYVGL